MQEIVQNQSGRDGFLPTVSDHEIEMLMALSELLASLVIIPVIIRIFQYIANCVATQMWSVKCSQSRVSAPYCRYGMSCILDFFFITELFLNQTTKELNFYIIFLQIKFTDVTSF